MASVAVLLAIGFALTLAIFYPGVMTFDSKYLHEYAMKGTMGDWQSPVMVWLWALIDPIAPGAGSMFLLIAATYWLGFGLLSLTLASRGSRVALLLPLLAMTPPSLALAGVIWRDVLFATCWLLAASIAFAAAERRSWIRLTGQTLALALVVFGVLLRPNALLAAPILAAYTIWLSRTSLRRAAIHLHPRGARLLRRRAGRLLRRPRREARTSAADGHDLRPRRHQPFCQGEPVSGRVERGGKRDAARQVLPADDVGHLLAARALRVRDAKGRARKGPVRYPGHIKRVAGGHRAASRCLSAAPLRLHVEFSRRRQSCTCGLPTSSARCRTSFPDRAAFNAFRAAHDALKPTPLLRAGFWLLACIVLCGIGWNRAPREAAFVFATCGSAAVYVLTFYGVGVASDFRYGYWAVLAAMAGGVVLLAGEGGRPAKEG